MSGRLRRAGLIVSGLLVCGTGARAAEGHDEGLDRPEGIRHVLFATPSRDAPGLRPLVIVLHGHGGSAAQVLGRKRSASPLARWLDKVDSEGLLVAAPDGARGTDGRQGWNDCRAGAEGNPRTDDVGLVAAIVARAVGQYRADPARVYAIGMSNGGMMTFRLAIELQPPPAAFAALSASMAERSVCAEPTQAVPALVVAGTADSLVPYGGGPVGVRSSGSRGAVLPVEQALATWRALAGLPAEPARRENLPHADAADPTRATRIVWGADPRGPQVELLRIDGGGHVEPSATQRVARLYARFVGAQNGDLEVVDEAWAFFKDKRAPR